MRLLAAIIIASLFATPGLAQRYSVLVPEQSLRQPVQACKCGPQCRCRGRCRCVPVRTVGVSFRQQLFIDAVNAGLVDQLDRRFRDGLQADDEILLRRLLGR